MPKVKKETKFTDNKMQKCCAVAESGAHEFSAMASMQKCNGDV